jgi:hypothetical protein
VTAKTFLAVASFAAGVLFGAFAIWGWTSMSYPDDIGAALLSISAGLLISHLPLESSE